MQFRDALNRGKARIWADDKKGGENGDIPGSSVSIGMT